MSSLAPELLINGLNYVDEVTGITGTETRQKKKLSKHDTNCTLKEDFPMYYQMLKLYSDCRFMPRSESADYIELFEDQRNERSFEDGL